MLKITTSAKDKLKDDLQREKKDDDTLIRIAPSSSDPQDLGLFLDKEKQGDQVITDNEGERLLLIDQDMAHALTGVTLDFADTGQGMRYSLNSSQT